MFLDMFALYLFHVKIFQNRLTTCTPWSVWSALYPAGLCTRTVLLAQLSSRPYMVPQTLVLGDDSNFIIKFYKTSNFLMCLGIHSALSAILSAWSNRFVSHGGGCGCISGDSPARASELMWVPHCKPAL